MKKILASSLICLILIVLFISCSNYDIMQESTTPHETTLVYNNESVELLTVYLPIPDHHSLDYISRKIQAEGFSLSFSALTHAPSIANMLQSPSENAIFIHGLPIAVQLLEQGLLQNLYDSVSQYTSNMIEAASSVNPYGRLYMIPTHERSRPANLAVLIRNDIFAEYNREIRSASDYEELLHWLWNQHPDIVPGIAAPMMTDKDFGFNKGYMATNLFLPERGYTSLAGMFNQGILLENNLWMNEERQVFAFYDIDAALQSFEKFSDWNRRGLIEFREDLSYEWLVKHPTILISMLAIRNLGFDASQFTINIFPEPSVNLPSIETVAFAAPDIDVSEFLRFLQWLDVIENYAYFGFGVEGIDHLRHAETGKIIERQHLPDSELYGSNHMAVFGREMFNEQLLDDTMLPKGFLQEILALQAKPQLLVLDRQSIHDIGRSLTNPAYRRDYMGAVEEHMDNLITLLYSSAIMDDTLGIIQDTFDQLRALNPNPRPADLVNEAIGRVGGH